MPLATLDDIKTRLQFGGTNKDDQLTDLLINVSDIAEQLIGRSLMRVVDRVEFVTDSPTQGRTARLSITPLETVTSVKQLWEPGSDAQFDAADAMVENTDYVIDAELGRLIRINGPEWFMFPRCLQVVYTGGWQDPSEVAIDGAQQVPGALQEAVIQQVIHTFNKGPSTGIKKTNMAGGRGGSIEYNDALLLPMFNKTCHRIKRWTI